MTLFASLALLAASLYLIHMFRKTKGGTDATHCITCGNERDACVCTGTPVTEPI